MTGKLKTATILKSEGAEVPTISKDELAILQKAAKQVVALEKAAVKLAEENATKLATLEKANLDATAQLKAIEVEKAAVAKTNMTELVKGFTFIGEDDQEAAVASLLKSKDAVILATLEKAQTAITAFAEAEHGTDATQDVEKSAAQQSNDDFDALGAEIMKSRKKGANA